MLKEHSGLQTVYKELGDREKLLTAITLDGSGGMSRRRKAGGNGSLQPFHQNW